MRNNIDEKYELLQHLNRVSELSERMAVHLGLDEELCKEVAIAGHLHDIGKLFIYPDILNKTGKLTKEERGYLQQHVRFSHIISLFFEDRLSEGILRMIKEHHESPSGNGYPEGLTGEKMHLGSHIIKICDVYDAMRSERPYRSKLSKSEALDQIMKESSNYKKECINALIEIESIYSTSQSQAV